MDVNSYIQSYSFDYPFLTIYYVCASLQSIETRGIRQQSLPVYGINVVTDGPIWLCSIDAGHLVKVDERIVLRAETELFSIFNRVSAVQVLNTADERRGIVASY